MGADGLFPLYFAIDLAAVERDAPALLARLQAAEQDALRDPRIQPCGVYAVFRKRAA